MSKKRFQLGGSYPTDEFGLSEGDIRAPQGVNFDNLEVPPMEAMPSTTDTPGLSGQIDMLKHASDKELSLKFDNPLKYYEKYGAYKHEDLKNAVEYSQENYDQLGVAPLGSQIPMQAYEGEAPEGPNLYKTHMSACLDRDGKSIEECSGGMQTSFDMNPDFSIKEKKDDLGIRGPAWQVGANIVAKGGERIYGLYDGTKPFRRSSGSVRNLLLQNKEDKGIVESDIADQVRNGDIIELFYRGSSFQDEALRDGNGAITTHVGVSTSDGDKKMVTHNMHGTWQTQPLLELLEGNPKLLVSGVVRPAYNKIYGEGAVQISPVPMMVQSGTDVREAKAVTSPEAIRGWEEKGMTGQANTFVAGLNYYAPYVMNDFGLDKDELDVIMRTSFGVFGKESGFGIGEGYVGKREYPRNIIRSYKQTFGELFKERLNTDPFSEGPSQIKLEGNFEGRADRDLLDRYGVDHNSIYDPRISAAATMLNTARNYTLLEQMLGDQFTEEDDITKRNILSLAHNKGIDNMIRNDFTNKKGFSRESIAEGIEMFRNIHIKEMPNTPEGVSYTNFVADYSSSLNIDHDAMMEAHLKDSRVNYDYREPYTLASKTGEVLDNTAKDMIAAPRNAVSEARYTALETLDLLRDGVPETKKKLDGAVEMIDRIRYMGEDYADFILALSFVEGNIMEGMDELDQATGVIEAGIESAKGAVGDTVSTVQNGIENLKPISEIQPIEIEDGINSIINEIKKTNEEVAEAGNASQSIIPGESMDQIQEAAAEMGTELIQEELQELINDPELQAGDISLEGAIMKIVQNRQMTSAGLPQYATGGGPGVQGLEYRDGGSLPKYQNGRKFEENQLQHEEETKTMAVPEIRAQEQQKKKQERRDLNPLNWRKNISNIDTFTGYNLDFQDFRDQMIYPKPRTAANSYSVFSGAAEAESNAFRKYLGEEQVGKNIFEPSPYQEGTFQLKGYEDEFPDDLTATLKDDPDLKKAAVADGRASGVKPFGDYTFGRHSVNKVNTKDGGFYLEYKDRWDLDPERIAKRVLGIRSSIDNIMEYEKHREIDKDGRLNKLLEKIGDMSERLLFNPFDIYGRIYYDKNNKRISTTKKPEFGGNNRTTPLTEFRDGGQLPKYQDGGPVKGWQGDRDAVNLMHTDGKKYSYNQLRESGYSDSVIVRNWNLDTTPELKARTTMAEPVMGFEQRPVEKTMTRGEAFRQARAAGEKEFTYEGKRYTTELASDKNQTLWPQRWTSVDQPVSAIPSTYNSSSIATPVTPRPYISPAPAAPYANMSREQLEEHIKQTWTLEEPYSTMPLLNTKHDLQNFENFPAEEMGFASENWDDERTWSTPMVLSKNGNTPKALSLNWYKDAQESDLEAIQGAELDDEGNKIYYEEDPVSYRIENVFDDPTGLSLDELRLVAANLDSVYDVSNPFDSPSTLTNKIKSINISPPSFSSPFGRHEGIVEIHTTPDSIPGKTEAKTFEFQDGGYLPQYQEGTPKNVISNSERLQQYDLNNMGGLYDFFSPEEVNQMFISERERGNPRDEPMIGLGTIGLGKEMERLERKEARREKREDRKNSRRRYPRNKGGMYRNVRFLESGGSLPKFQGGGQLPEYQDGGDVKYISDPEEFKKREEEFKKREQAYNDYNDSLNLYEQHKQFYRDIARSNSADPSKYPYDLILKENEKFNTKGGAYKIFDTGESLYIASPEHVSAQRSKGYDDDFVFEDPKYIKESKIKPQGVTMQSYKDYNYLFKKPTQPVAQPLVAKSMAKPVSGFDKKPEWAKFNSTMDRIQQYEKPAKPKKGSTAKKIQGVQGLPYEYGGSLPKYQTGGELPKYQDGAPEHIPSTAYNAGPAWGHMLPEVKVEDTLDRTNPTAVRNWSQKHDPIAYAARENMESAADVINSSADFAPGYGDARDVMHLVKAIKDRDWGTVGIAAGAAALPFVGYGMYKGAKRIYNGRRGYTKGQERILDEVAQNSGDRADFFDAAAEEGLQPRQMKGGETQKRMDAYYERSNAVEMRSHDLDAEMDVMTVDDHNAIVDRENMRRMSQELDIRDAVESEDYLQGLQFYADGIDPNIVGRIDDAAMRDFLSSTLGPPRSYLARRSPIQKFHGAIKDPKRNLILPLKQAYQKGKLSPKALFYNSQNKLPGDSDAHSMFGVSPTAAHSKAKDIEEGVLGAGNRFSEQSLSSDSFRLLYPKLGSAVRKGDFNISHTGAFNPMNSSGKKFVPEGGGSEETLEMANKYLERLRVNTGADIPNAKMIDRRVHLPDIVAERTGKTSLKHKFDRNKDIITATGAGTATAGLYGAMFNIQEITDYLDKKIKPTKPKMRNGGTWWEKKMMQNGGPAESTGVAMPRPLGELEEIQPLEPWAGRGIREAGYGPGASPLNIPLSGTEKVARTFHDAGTKAALLPRTMFTLEGPSQEELDAGRKGWKGRGNSMVEGATWEMGAGMIGAGLGAGARYAGNRLANMKTPMQAYRDMNYRGLNRSLEGKMPEGRNEYPQMWDDILEEGITKEKFLDDHIQHYPTSDDMAAEAAREAAGLPPEGLGDLLGDIFGKKPKSPEHLDALNKMGRDMVERGMSDKTAPLRDQLGVKASFGSTPALKPLNFPSAFEKRRAELMMDRNILDEDVLRILNKEFGPDQTLSETVRYLKNLEKYPADLKNDIFSSFNPIERSDIKGMDKLYQGSSPFKDDVVMKHYNKELARWNEMYKKVGKEPPEGAFNAINEKMRARMNRLGNSEEQRALTTYDPTDRIEVYDEINGTWKEKLNALGEDLLKPRKHSYNKYGGYYNGSQGWKL